MLAFRIQTALHQSHCFSHSHSVQPLLKSSDCPKQTKQAKNISKFNEILNFFLSKTFHSIFLCIQTGGKNPNLVERPDSLLAGVGLEVSHHHLFDEQSRTCSGSPLRRARPVRHHLVLRFYPHSPSQLTEFPSFFGWFHEKWNFEKGLKIMGQKEREREKSIEKEVLAGNWKVFIFKEETGGPSFGFLVDYSDHVWQAQAVNCFLLTIRPV